MCQSQVSTTPCKIKWNPRITCLKRNVIFQTVIFELIDSDQQKRAPFRFGWGELTWLQSLKRRYTPWTLIANYYRILQATGPVWENSTSNFSKIESNLSLQSGFYRRYFTRQLPFRLTVTGDRVLAANVDLSPNTGQWEAPSRHASGKVDPL